MQKLRSANVESCYISSIDNQLRIINSKEFCTEGVAEVTIDIYSLISFFQPSTKYAVIIHNHPSGKTYPSRADLMATHKLVQISELLHFKILDHLIVTKEHYFSFAESGILEDIKNQFS